MNVSLFDQLTGAPIGRERMDAAGGTADHTRHDAARAAARSSDPDTSHQAAQQAQGKAGRHRDRVLALLREAGPEGMDDFAIAAALGLQPTSSGVRRGELLRAGLVEWSGRYGTSPSGAKCRIWRAT